MGVEPILLEVTRALADESPAEHPELRQDVSRKCQADVQNLADVEEEREVVGRAFAGELHRRRGGPDAVAILVHHALVEQAAKEDLIN